VGGTVTQSPSQEILGYNSLNMKKSPTAVLSSINSIPHEKRKTLMDGSRGILKK
jgi:hypothetical protein